MTELEQATIDFFKAVLKTGRDILGHTEFGFKVDAMISTKTEDAELGKMIGQRIQEALDIAKATATPIMIEGTSLQ